MALNAFLETIVRGISVCSILLALGAAPAVAAQGVPLLSLESTGGSGAHTGQTSHIYYNDDRVNFFRFAATVRLGTSGAVRPLVTVERTPGCGIWLGVNDLNCPVAPDGSCRQFFNEPEGTAVALGLGGNWSRLNGELAAGTAWYSPRARYLDANASLRIAPHVAIVGDARHIIWTNAGGDRNWFFPVSMGLRIY